MNYASDRLTQKPCCKCGCGEPVKWDKDSKNWCVFAGRGHSSRIYSYSKTLFATIETQHDAYWLGFFIADGFVKTRGTFGFHLAEKDLPHLEKFQSYGEITQPIIVDDKFCRLEVSGIRHLPTLAKWGLVQKKSEFIAFPTILPELRNHLIRGIFDGDGWVVWAKRTSSLGMGIIGNRGLLTEIQNIFIKECNVKRNKLRLDRRHKNDWVVSLQYTGNLQSRRIFEYLYADSTIHLDRKYNAWKCRLAN